MNSSKLLLWSIVSALAGFLFGFDTVVISGADKPIQDIWNLNGFMHGLAMSAALWGTVLGSFFGGIPTDRLGRKKTLLWIGILYFVSAVGSGLAPEVYSFILFRFIGGLGVGISTVAAPLYISEIAPPARRGRLAGLFQFNIVFGILIAFGSNWLLGGIGENAWRWMLGVEAIPAVVYAVLCFGIPESPRWLISRKGDHAQAIKTLALIEPGKSAAELEADAKIIEDAKDEEKKLSGFWSLKTPIMLAFLIAAFNQLSGINIILYFAPRLLGSAGIEDPLLASISLGVTNLIFTFVGLYFIDRLGRRTLLLIGSIGYIASLGLCAWAFGHYAEFTVISKATALEGVAGKELRFPAKTAQEISETNTAFAKARAELIASTEAGNYRGTVVEIPVDASPQEFADIAGATSKVAIKSLKGAGILVLVGLIGFIAAHAMGQGAVIWVFISEIFPNMFRASGQSLGSFTHWFFAAGLTLLFPIVIAAISTSIIFWFFCGMMALQLLWVLFLVPETKGASLEDLEKKMMH